MRKPPNRVVLGAGAALVFVVLLGGDFYTGDAPTFKDVLAYLFISAVLSPLGAAAVALKAGWTRQASTSRVPIWLVVLVVAGMIVALVVGQSAGE